MHAILFFVYSPKNLTPEEQKWIVFLFLHYLTCNYNTSIMEEGKEYLDITKNSKLNLMIRVIKILLESAKEYY
jgi:hypothetical protein